jgi:hypothetical protein
LKSEIPDMAREDDFQDDDDRPRRPRRREDDEDRPRRSNRDLPPPKKSNAAMIVGIICATLLLICGGGMAAVWIGCNRVAERVKTTTEAFVKEAQVSMKDQGEASETASKLRELGVKLDQHRVKHESFPGDSYDATGKPLLSWRVHLLPLLNRADLHKKFKLDEPWDSPANRAFLKEMPGEYATGASRTKAGNEKTYFRGFSGPGAMFERVIGPPVNGGPPRGQNPQGVTDGLSGTIMLIEAGDPIEWTRPDELTLTDKIPAVGGISPQNPFFLVLMADGVVKKARRTIDPATFRALVNRQDAVLLGNDWEVP